MGIYLRLPLEIQATQWFKDGDHPVVKPLTQGLHTLSIVNPVQYFIRTLEGDMRVIPGDWIITGIRGEHYPCKDEIFKETYQEVDSC